MSLFLRFFRSFNRRSGHGRRQPRPAYRPALETLEPRLALATFTVDTLSDTVGNTLRAAITAANASSDPSNSIIFTGAARSGVITLNSALPNISNNLSIIGPGAAALTVRRAAGAPQFSVFTVS